MNIAEIVMNKVAALPEKRQRDVLHYVEVMEKLVAGQAFKSSYGSMKGIIPDLSLEDFQQNRREMWQGSALQFFPEQQ